MYNNILLVGINSKYIHTNLAIRYLKKYVQANSQKKIDIYESTINNSTQEILEEIFLKKPEVVFFSVYIWNKEEVIKIAESLKKVSPNIKIGFGGPEVSWNAEEILESKKYLDFIISGEGEKSLLNLIENGENSTKSLYYRDANNIIFNGYEKLIKVLDSIPFPYEIEFLEDSKIIYYETTRGCPHNCSYCISSIEKKLRFFSLDRVKKDMQHLLDNGVKLVKFIDRTFNINRNRYGEIWRYLIDNYNEKTTFHFEIKIDDLTEEDFLILDMAPEGYFQFEVGIQSINQRTLEDINRKNDLGKIEANVSRLTKNINLHLDLIAGLPFEDYNSFLKSFEFVYSLKPDMLQLGFLKLLYGTQIRAEEEKHLYKFLEFPPYEVLKNRYINYYEMIDLKHIEKLLDIYYNSGDFKYINEYLSEKYNKISDFYMKFSEYWISNNLFKVSHKKHKYYNYLYEFLIIEGFEKIEIRSYMTVDYLLMGKTGYYPKWLESIKDKERQNLIIKDMGFENRREGHKKTDYEILEYDIFERVKKKIGVLFTYNNKNSIRVFDYEG